MPSPHTHKTQLEFDLCRRIETRLDLWTHDSIHLYQMADLTPEACFRDLVGALVIKLIHLMTELKIEPLEIGRLMHEMAVKSYEIKKEFKS